MAKVTRSVLKEIVKECLVEILFEGIDSEPGMSEDPSIVRETLTQKGRSPSRPSPKRKQKAKPRIKKSAIEDMVGGLTQDPMMAAIFADTAQTTLLEQREGPGRTQVTADNAAEVAKDNNPEDLFEGAENWAALAFDEVGNKQ